MPDGDHDGWSSVLPLYELGRLSQEERDRFEGHVLTCDACFAELERGSIVTATLREQRERFLAAVQPLAGARSGGASGMASRLRSILSRRVLTPALVAVAAIAVVVLFTSRDQGDVRKWATFPGDIESAELLRAPGSQDPVQEALNIGAGHYDLGHIDEAERYFRAALARDSTSSRASYFLGLCKIRRGKPDEASAPLRDALRTAPTNERSRIAWALANAHLAAGQIEESRRVLEDMIAEGGEWSEEAGLLLQRLPP